jgi:hypothetical protein
VKNYSYKVHVPDGYRERLLSLLPENTKTVSTYNFFTNGSRHQVRLTEEDILAIKLAIPLVKIERTKLPNPPRIPREKSIFSHLFDTE